MTKEEIINQYTPLDDPANKGKEFSVIRYMHLYKAMDEWAAIQNKVLIDALKEAQAKLKECATDLVTSTGRVRFIGELNSLITDALASYVEQAPQESNEDEVPEEFIERHLARIKTLQKELKEKFEGQVTGKSAVWENIGPSTDPKESKVYNVKKNREGREIIGECMYDNILGEWNGDWDQWLDTSGEAGKQPEQQPADRKEGGVE